MIASSEATDILRNGWADAAAALAPELPDLAQLFQARLDEAFATGATSEEDLLAAVDEVAATAVRAGSAPSPVLARRLRRTVYEYLLALDASAAVQPQPVPSPDPTAAPPDAFEDAAGAGREAPATWAPRAHSLPEPPMWTTHAAAAAEVATDHTPPAQELPGETATPDEHEPSPADAALASSAACTTPDGETVEPVTVAEEEPTAATSPLTDEDLPPIPHPAWYLDRSAVALPVDEPTVDGAPSPDEEPPAASDDAEHTVGVAEAADATTWSPWSDAAALSLETAADEVEAPLQLADDTSPGPAQEVGSEPAVTPRFVAPRDGFHIVEGALATDEVPAAAPPSTFAAFSSDAAPAAQDETAGGPSEPVDDWLRVLRNGHTEPDASTADGGHALNAFDDEFDDDQASWQVRNGAPSGVVAGPGMSAPARDGVDADDPFVQDPHLAETRRKVQDRLRRKRCDEAAALLQLLAQEAGGRAVAELAMDAGDRCRALGKTNAALNCYLAASRSDPVYELPLSRLADICIDDQDIELAVTYLERIARLARMRGDDKAALRVYRRIATVAPYREDILALLMQVQSGTRPTV